MSTITAILEPDPDGTLHLPLPPELRHVRVKVEATLLPCENAEIDARPDPARLSGDLEEPLDELEPLPRATPEMIKRRIEAADALRAMGGLKDIIPDPVAWQREVREDRALPGRE